MFEKLVSTTFVPCHTTVADSVLTGKMIPEGEMGRKHEGVIATGEKREIT